MKSQHQPLTEYPHGWFAVGYSADIRTRPSQEAAYFGHELVLFRTMSGKAALFDAYCPHLGAHLGHGGTVTGESIRCPFHGLCFDLKGECTFSPHDNKMNLTKWELIEHGGFLFSSYRS